MAYKIRALFSSDLSSKATIDIPHILLQHIVPYFSFVTGHMFINYSQPSAARGPRALRAETTHLQVPN